MSRRRWRIVVTDADRTITQWNPADLIFTPEDMAFDAAGEEMRAAAWHAVAPDERWHLKKDGSRFWGSGTMTSLHGPDGRVSGFVKVFRDATARHQGCECREVFVATACVESLPERWQRYANAAARKSERGRWPRHHWSPICHQKVEKPA